MGDEAFDWDEHYDWEWQENTCSLCARWLKRFLGSDELILAIEDFREFLSTAHHYRSPEDAAPCGDERLRRERERWVRERGR
jgi:hypothetical protein